MEFELFSCVTGTLPMSSPWHKHPIPALAATLALALLLAAPPPTAAQAPASLAGQLLVASPSMGDPRFERTVILMIRHDKDGAFGIVVNRPAGERPLAELIQMLGEKDAAVAGQVRIFAGGPVQPELGFVIHGTDYRGPGTMEITARLAMTSSREILRDIGGGKGPKQSLIAFGYAGWAPGQLEGELKRRDWSIAPGEPKLIFDEDRDKVWDSAYAQRTQDL
ncbi:MAG TPA: YqgE/AlgH family protein [Xanthobacteraceae bacterium]|nr:YqgE/AlgH family protein [Xanthobacteraceae bacterium]